MSKHPDHGGFDFHRQPVEGHSVAVQIALFTGILILACVIGALVIVGTGGVV